MTARGGYLTINEAARRVDRSVTTIRRWIDEGMAEKVGFVREAELLEFERSMRARRGRPRKMDPDAAVAAEVAAARERQNAKWGEQNHPDGTGPHTQPLYAATATGIADDDEAHLIRDMLRGRTDWRFSGGIEHFTIDRPGTWTDILLEEVFEALAEDDPERLKVELIQVAAVAEQWAAALIRRAAVAGSAA